jgi:hypothetical protein
MLSFNSSVSFVRSEISNCILLREVTTKVILFGQKWSKVARKIFEVLWNAKAFD